ncbi:MAG: efflux RND transporter permease subunit, partial [Acidobacteriota bacterium]
MLGILVDDAIVVGESIHEARRDVRDPREAAILGVNRVSTATVFGAMTTLAAFFPLLLIDNDVARLFAGFSAIVIAAVSMSLVESKFILPAHLADPGKKRQGGPLSSAWRRLRLRLDRGFETLVRSWYRRLLLRVLHHRYAALVFLVTVAVLGIGLMATGRIGMVFFPEVPGNTVIVNLAMDPSSPETLTQRNADHLEAAVHVVNQRLLDEHALDSPPISKAMVALGGLEVEAYGELTREAMDTLGNTVVLNAWRREVGALEGAQSLRFTGSLETSAFEVLMRIEEDLAKVPERWPGLVVRGAGELEEMGEVQAGMKRALGFIAVLIFALLAEPLRSYSKPLVILSVVPFAFMGAAFGHFFLDLPLSILSLFGMLAATGVVVND